MLFCSELSVIYIAFFVLHCEPLGETVTLKRSTVLHMHEINNFHSSCQNSILQYMLSIMQCEFCLYIIKQAHNDRWSWQQSFLFNEATALPISAFYTIKGRTLMKSSCNTPLSLWKHYIQMT